MCLNLECAEASTTWYGEVLWNTWRLKIQYGKKGCRSFVTISKCVGRSIYLKRFVAPLPQR